MASPYPTLLSPVRLGALTLPNRVLMGSMHTGLEETGDWGRVAAFYAARAGAGLIVTGGMAPNREGGVYPGAAGLHTAGRRGQPPPGHRRGPRGGRADRHADPARGRYAYGKDCVAPSALKSPISPFPPRALDEEGIEAQVAAIATAAARAARGGLRRGRGDGVRGLPPQPVPRPPHQPPHRRLGREPRREPDAPAASRSWRGSARRSGPTSR